MAITQGGYVTIPTSSGNYTVIYVIGTTTQSEIFNYIVNEKLGVLYSLEEFMMSRGKNDAGGFVYTDFAINYDNTRAINFNSDKSWLLDTKYNSSPYMTAYNVDTGGSNMGCFYGVGTQSQSYTAVYPYTYIVFSGTATQLSIGLIKCKKSILDGSQVVSDFWNQYNTYMVNLFSNPYKPSENYIDIFTQRGVAFNNYVDPVLPTDPYSGAGDSGTGGGDGTFDGSSDPVPVPSLPTVGATDAGFITLYAPTTSQLKNLAYTCWVGLLDDVWTNFRKLFTDPMDCILGLSVVPVSVPTSGTQDVAIGNIPTGVSMNVASQQYIEVDCGTVSFTKESMNWHFGSYLDYEPYTKIAIYLPYIGVHQLNTDDIMGRVIQVVYHIDILTGSCIAFVKCGNSVLYQFNGACASNIPVNSLNYASTIENAIRIAVNIGTTVATAGASAPLSAGAEGASAGVKTAQNVARGVSMAGATAEGALSMKPSIGRSGSLGGTTGLMGNQIPYFIITRPRLCKPKNQDFYKGYPSFIQTTLGDLDGKGYTEFDTVILAGLYLTDTEKSELLNILAGGVYL